MDTPKPPANVRVAAIAPDTSDASTQRGTSESLRTARQFRVGQLRIGATIALVDDFERNIFRSEVALQCKAIISANGALARAVDPDEVWIALQGLLVAAANASKLLWGSGGKATSERAYLRDGIVGEDSPLESPDLRNDFEHFDDRIAKYFEGESNWVTLYVGRNIGQNRATPIDDQGRPRAFGHFDPATGVVSFWTHSSSVPELINEAARLLAALDSPVPPAAATYTPPLQGEASSDHSAQSGSSTIVQVELREGTPPEPPTD